MDRGGLVHTTAEIAEHFRDFYKHLYNFSPTTHMEDFQKQRAWIAQYLEEAGLLSASDNVCLWGS